MKNGVFIYSNFNFSVKNAGVTRMLYYAQAIANPETSVYLATCSSSPISQEVFEEVFPNVFVLKQNTITQSFFGTLKYIKNYFRFAKKVSHTQTFLFYPSPLIYLELIALYYLKFLKKCTVFYELNEVRKHTSTFHEKLSIKRPFYSVKKVVYKSVFSTLEHLLRYYDGLICISSAIEKYGQKFNSNTLRVPILTNPYLEKEFSTQSYTTENSFNIGFSGSIHPTKENLINFLKVLGELKKHDINVTLNLCGPIKQEHQKLLLEELVNSLEIKDHINYFGKLNAKELSTFLDQQQLLIIPRGYTLQNNFGFSTKLSDYLDHGKPILVTDVSDNKLFIKDGINGFIVPPDDNTMMFNKLFYIIAEYDNIYESIKANAHKTSVQNFYYKNFHTSLNQFLFDQS